MLVGWGSGGNDSVSIHTSFQPQFNYGNNAVSTSMTLTGTSGMQIGSTISIATPTTWKNPFLNTLPASSFYGFAFISQAKCGEQNSSYIRVYFNSSDWNFSGNGFQIPASAVDANNRTIADLTGYGVEFMIHPTANNMMTDRVGPFKIGESTLVACTHPFVGGGGGGGFGMFGPRPPVPAGYAGPELSGLSSKEIISGTSSRLEGKNLSSVTSIEIGGKPATFKLDGSSALDLTVPAGLAPGLYDLVINSPSGKLTHINAILVREPLRSFSITSRSEGRISEEHYQEHTIVASMQLPELNKARCVVNGPNLAQARAQAARLCALVKAANPNIQATVVEARSTVKGNTVFARVSYGWTK